MLSHCHGCGHAHGGRPLWFALMLDLGAIIDSHDICSGDVGVADEKHVAEKALQSCVPSMCRLKICLCASLAYGTHVFAKHLGFGMRREG